MPKSVNDMVTEARATIDNLSVSDAAREMQRGDALLVDVREPEERTQNGVIPGAISAPRGMLEFYADPSTPHHKKALEPNRRIILHCALGMRSALAARTLREMGFSRVAHLDGGFKAWKEAGQPTTMPK